MHTRVTASHAAKYVLQALKPFKFNLTIMLLVAIYNGLSISISPFILKVILNRVTEVEHTAASLFSVLAIPVILYLLTQFFVTVSYRFYEYFVKIRMMPALRANLVQQATTTLLDQSHNYFQNTFAGSLANKVNDLGNSIPELLQVIVDRFALLGMTILFAIINLCFVSYKFSLLMFSWVALFIICILMNYKRITKQAEMMSEQISSITGKVVDIFSNILSVRLFSAKTQEENVLAKTIERSVTAERKLYWTYFWIFLFYGILAFALTAFSLYFLIQGKQRGELTVGDFALVLMLNLSIMEQLWMLAKDFADFSKVSGRIMQSLNTILVKPEIMDSPSANKLIVTNGQIDFAQVHFNYKGHDAIFRAKTVTIPSGQKVGLVGYSGGGKTTFVNLILRLYDVTSGAILIDKQDIRTVTQDSLHAAIGMIPQDPLLFHRSLFDNIQYANINATANQVYAAAKRAHAHEFITKLPNGYASLVGERGIKISGGQRQRIAIARAILKNAPILILDEATSQLDSVTEGFIQESLWELMQNKTTIVIAHRLSTLLHMDRILVFDQGKIVEDGTHQELLAKHRLYKTLWDAQVGGFLPSTTIEA